MLLRLVLLLYELLLSSNITSKEKLNQLKKLQENKGRSEERAKRTL